MALTVGTDSYITAAQADEYLALYIQSDSSQLSDWDDLSDPDKEVHLRNAMIEIEGIRFVGRKESETQTLSFPRCYIQHGITGDIYTKFQSGWVCDDDVPDEVKAAQAIEAMELASPGPDSYNAKRRAAGIKSQSAQSASESYERSDPAGLTARIRSVRAAQLLQKYTQGGFRIVRPRA